MNRAVTSREAILAVGREIVREAGTDGLNIRDVAARCNISVGLVYNYFQSKSDLSVAIIASVWQEIMQGFKPGDASLGFAQAVESWFCNMQKGFLRYPGFFSVHSMSAVGKKAEIDKSHGRNEMEAYLGMLKGGLLKSLCSDKRVRADAFSDDFTPKSFVDFVFSNVISILARGETSCEFLLEVIKRTIY